MQYISPRSAITISSWNLIVLCCAIIVCGLAFHAMIYEPILNPDSALYIKLADNLRSNWCYSGSDPVQAQCRPTWAYQPPGYPIFIAVAGIFLPNSVVAIVAGQVLVFLAAVLCLL